MSKQKRNLAPIVQSHPSSPTAEAYHTIRTNIQFRGDKTQNKVILITSANRGEGRSFIASNLAVTLAQTRQRVLIIDADMRKPDIHQQFRVANESGLSQFLTQEKNTPEYFQSADVPGLHLLTSGPKPTNAASLLSTDRFSQYMTRVRREFDMVIIDAPPTLVASDALIISRVADGVVFVVDAQKTNRAMAQKALATIQRHNDNIIGGILNRIPRGSRKYPIGMMLQQSPPTLSVKA